MAMTRKHRCHERLQALPEVYRVLDSVVYLDPHEYGFWEKGVRQALRGLEKSDPTLETLHWVEALLDNVLSQALNRDPNLPWVVGAKKVSGNVGEVK
jgi:hypothetical protein